MVGTSNNDEPAVLSFGITNVRLPEQHWHSERTLGLRIASTETVKRNSQLRAPAPHGDEGPGGVRDRLDVGTRRERVASRSPLRGMATLRAVHGGEWAACANGCTLHAG